MEKKKKILRKGNIQLPCGQAKPGASLSSLNINMPLFCREFNDRTRNKEIGEIVNVKVKVFSNKEFEFEIKAPPVSLLLKKYSQNKILSNESLNKIFEEVKDYLNTKDPEKARKMILGSAKSAGIKLEN